MFRAPHRKPARVRLSLCNRALPSVVLGGSCLILGCAPSAPVQAQAAAPAVDEVDELEPAVVTAFTDEVLLFLEYPQLLPGVEARFLAHFTVLATGEPVRSGSVQLEISGDGAETLLLEATEPARDGLFIPVGALPTAGEYSARIVLTSEQASATIAVDEIEVHASLAEARAHAEAHAAEHAAEEPDHPVPMLLEQQWKIGLLTEPAATRTLIERLRVPGEIEAVHHSMAVASSPIAGRLLPGDSKRLPHVGDRIEAGQVLALIEPPITLSDHAQRRANEATRQALEVQILLREFDLRTQITAVEQALRQGTARIEYAARNLERIEGLRSSELGTIAELEAARQAALLSQREQEASQAQFEALIESQNQLVELRARNQPAARTEGAELHQVIAPISGEVVSADHVVGEHVESQAPICRLLDLDQVWIAAHISEFDLAQIGPDPGALMRLAAYPDRTFDLFSDLNGRIAHVGRIVDPETRTLKLHYEVDNPDTILRAGMFADIYLETNRAVAAVALHSESIVMDQGLPVAFVMHSGEEFAKREVELGVRDGDWVEVKSGIEAGERVVTRGAYFVKLASVSPAELGHGHAH